MLAYYCGFKHTWCMFTYLDTFCSRILNVVSKLYYNSWNMPKGEATPTLVSLLQMLS